MTPKFRVLIAEPKDFSSRAVKILEAEAAVELRACTDAELPQAFRDYDVVWIRLGHRIGAKVLGTAPRCKILASNVTGIDHIDVDACRACGVEVVSLRGETAFLREIRGTAEHTIALTLALLRRIPEAFASVRDGLWNRDLFRGRELFGRAAGIVGFGRIGSLVAGYFGAFGMSVLAYDPKVTEWPRNVERVSELDELLRRADVASVHVTYEPATRHLLGAPQLAQMKRDAVLVNTSRGGVVDEAALLAALESGSIAGAALDVLEGEPEVMDNRLIAYARRAKNLLIVPHIGGNTHESLEKTEVFLAERVLEKLRQLETP